MEDLVTRLLTLTRAEQNAILLRPERVMLAPLLHALWEPLQLKATAKQLTTRFDLPGDAALETDPFLLRGILDNLLANSANYTPARGSIHLGFTRTADRFALTITNTTEELTPAELPRLFERFWRKDNARSDAEHAGLGLSLARAFASLLGMHITASFPADRTLSLTLSGRVAPVAAPSAAPSDDSIGSGGHL